jgi:membrane protein implicated in regulation of membrane protease activity
MSAWVWWFVLGFAILIAELMTGTFYLLVIALAFAAAGAASIAGMPFAVQLVVAAGIGLAGSLWLRNSRFGRSIGRKRGAPLQDLDVGQVVVVPQWSDRRTARVPYRGADWDVELAAGEDAAPGEFEIRDVRGSRLIVARRAAKP